MTDLWSGLMFLVRYIIYNVNIPSLQSMEGIKKISRNSPRVVYNIVCVTKLEFHKCKSGQVKKRTLYITFITRELNKKKNRFLHEISQTYIFLTLKSMKFHTDHRDVKLNGWLRFWYDLLSSNFITNGAIAVIAIIPINV